MKVKIGNYKNWVGPYQVADWFKPVFGEDRIEKFTDGKIFDKLSDWTMPMFTFIEKHKPQRVEKVKIDRWHSYSADHTLSLIIVPLLENLKENKHGSPFTDDEDVPERLRSTSGKSLTEKDKQNGELDEFFHQRFEWILDEMIWAMTQIRDENWEKQYHTGKSDWVDEKIEIEGEVYYEMVEGPKHTAKFDKDGYTAHFERIKNGTTLFGKYFQNLWD